MKSLYLPLLLVFTLAACTAETESSTAEAEAEVVQGDFTVPMGVQLWSFRKMAEEEGAVAMLDMVKDVGFTHVETAGLYGMTGEEMATTLDNAGLEATSMHAPYDAFKNNIDQVIADAKAVGAEYAGIAWYPHEEGNFDEATARQAIADFNEFGQAMKDAGLKFFYHNHGYEPGPYGDGTLLDLIIDETDPELVYFEMDVLWTWLPNLDPVEVIARHPGRFKLMHIKDMKPGIERGTLAGRIPDEDKAVIGEGQVDWPAVLKAATEDGFEHFYLEDETTEPVDNAPVSYAYLKALKYDE